MTIAIFVVVTFLSLFFMFQLNGGSIQRILPFVMIQLIVGGLAYLGVFVRLPLLLPVCILVATILLFLWNRKVVEKENLKLCFTAVHVLRIPVEIGLLYLYMENTCLE